MSESRRDFLRLVGAAAALPLMTTSRVGHLPEPKLLDLSHMKLCYSKDCYCGHPRQSGIFNYGNGELVMMHSHAPCRYEQPDDVSHSFTTGYASRAQILLQRSFDNGETWPRDQDVVVWDESLPLEEKKSRVAKADLPDVPREQIDLTSHDSAVYFARPAIRNENPPGDCFVFRSADRGRHWEEVPTRVNPPAGRNYVHRDAHPLVRFPDGTLMGAMTVLGGQSPGAVAVYGSDDQGLTWEYLAEVARDPTGLGRPTYAGLILLPGGRLQCYMLNIGGICNAIQMAHSDDGGYSWSSPQPIVCWGKSPWAGRRSKSASRSDQHYRSPWPIMLADGRIVVLFTRRKPPFGIGLIVSEDQGNTWSVEAIVRDDGDGRDLGYPVATQLEDGRIFTAYYFTQNDGNGLGGTRHIAGSFFRLG